MNKLSNYGNLYIVATPLGNLGDITKRAVETLKNADIIASEDTRVTGKLLSFLGIGSKQSISCFKGNEVSRVDQIIELLKNGKNIALVSDAGTPAISDPGAQIVREVAINDIKVIPIPGPSAITALYSVSGFVSTQFRFEGFIPRKGILRKKCLEAIATSDIPVVFYESPHRFLKTISDLIEVVDETRNIVVGREITKLFEEIFRGNISEALEHFSKNEIRGEFSVVIDGIKHFHNANLPPLSNEIKRLLDLNITPKLIGAILHNIYSVSKREIYQLALELKK